MKIAPEKSPKKTKHNIVLEKSTKVLRDKIKDNSPWMEDYQDFFTHRMHPVNQAFLDRLGAELIEYAETTKTIFRLEWFFTQKRIAPQTAREWASKNESFAKTYAIAKYVLGMRREDKGLRKEFDSSMISATMPLYDEDWKKLLEWKALMAEKTNAPSTVIVQMEPFKEEK